RPQADGGGVAVRAALGAHQHAEPGGYTLHGAAASEPGRDGGMADRRGAVPDARQGNYVLDGPLRSRAEDAGDVQRAWAAAGARGSRDRIAAGRMRDRRKAGGPAP